MKFITLARQRAVAIFLLLAILAAAGAYEAGALPSSIFPSVTFPQVKVIADVGDEPAAQMMPTVTRVIEEAILRVPGIVVVRSTTSRGSSELSAEFTWNTDMQTALNRVQAETQRIRPDLPPQARIDVEWMNTATFPIQGYALSSATLTQAQLWDLAQFTLKPALVRIPGVAQVQIQGGRQREFQVHLNRAALIGRHLAVSDVVQALSASNDVVSTGLSEQNHELYLTLVTGRVSGLDSLAQIAVPVPGGTPATLADLGTVLVADAVSYIRTSANGHSAVLLNIVRQPSANTVAIANGIERLFKEQPDLLPRGVEWSNFYDQAKFVSDSVRGARDAIIIGVVLAALVLLLFLRNWRFTLIAVAAIPITVAVVGLALGVAGQTINLMTLAGIAASLGLIADDAIVVIENIDTHHREGTSQDPTESGAGQLRPALIGSSLSTIVILLPFALLTGVVGAFFKPLALTMALALVISFIVALIAVPVAVSLLRRKDSKRNRPEASLAGVVVTMPVTTAMSRQATMTSPDGERMSEETPTPIWAQVTGALSSASAGARRGYRAVIDQFLRSGAIAAIVTLALLATTYVLYRRIGTDFLPSMDEGSIILDYWTPPGTSLSETDEMLRVAERVIDSVPDVESYSRRTGTQLGFFITEPNRGDYVIKLKPLKQRRGVDEIIDELRTKIGNVEPAIHTDFGQLLEDNIGDLTGGTPQPIDVKIFGDDPALLAQKANQVAKLLGKVSGVEDVFNGITIAGPALSVHVNAVAAARFGLNTQMVAAEVEPAITGSVAGQIRVGDRMYDLRVFAPAEGPLPALKIRAAAPSTSLIPLSSLASISTGAPEAEIDRENLKTYVGVTARLSGRDLGGAMNDIRSRIAHEVQLPPGMHIDYGGLYQQQQQSFLSLFYVLLSGLLLVSVVVLFEFADWRAPIVTSLCAVAGLAGVLAALLLTGQTLNISSYVGAIMMVGIVGENAIFVIHEAQLALRAGHTVRDSWAEAAERRLRPVAMTILATAFALAPLALAVGQGSQLMQPLAIAVIGGFVLSGPIVLLVLPGLYCLLDPHGKLGKS
ncbi:MAG: efflux RND transporter permease subunit [Gemmatimonadota bacterium]|nr:efflux RND transporter permease subunit [Gemmatimonadota bacterium]